MSKFFFFFGDKLKSIEIKFLISTKNAKGLVKENEISEKEKLFFCN